MPRIKVGHILAVYKKKCYNEFMDFFIGLLFVISGTIGLWIFSLVVVEMIIKDLPEEEKDNIRTNFFNNIGQSK